MRQRVPASRLIARLVVLTLVCPGIAAAQTPTCRALPAGTAIPLPGRIESWPEPADELLLGRLLHADLLSDGSAVVLDRTRAELVRVDVRSGRVTTLARKGEGPGEIGTIAGMAVTTGDTIVLLDRSKRRVVRLTQHGKLVSSTPYEPLGLSAFIGSLGSEVIEVSRQRPQGGKLEPVIMTVRRIGSESTSIVRRVELRDPASEPGIFTPVGFGELVQGSRLLLASGISPDITVVPLGGSRDTTMRLAIGPPRHATRELAEQILDVALPQFPKTERQRVIADILRGSPVVPSYPMFARLAVGSSGAVWVQRTYLGDDDTGQPVPPGLSMDDLGSSVWLRFSPSGSASAECRTPPDWRVLLARRGTVVFVMDDPASTRIFTWRLR